MPQRSSDLTRLSTWLLLTDKNPSIILERCGRARVKTVNRPSENGSPYTDAFSCVRFSQPPQASRAHAATRVSAAMEPDGNNGRCVRVWGRRGVGVGVGSQRGGLGIERDAGTGVSSRSSRWRPSRSAEHSWARRWAEPLQRPALRSASALWRRKQKLVNIPPGVTRHYKCK